MKVSTGQKYTEKCELEQTCRLFLVLISTLILLTRRCEPFTLTFQGLYPLCINFIRHNMKRTALWKLMKIS
uniref:Putative peptidase family m13 n=1 Tax=Ixodes ricinus TaxID=34613 RepID=A0A0K8RH29_IXORI